MPSTDIFAAQDEAYRAAVLPPGVRRVSMEVASPFGWREWVGDDGLVLGIDHFGASAPAAVLAEKLGFTPAQITGRILDWI